MPVHSGWIAHCAGMLVVATACVSESSSTGDVVVRDSAGITLVESSARLSHGAASWSIDSVPDITIGVAEGEPAHQLYRIAGVAALRDGRILVVNAGTQELRFFDAGGAFLHGTGRNGDGPGEFRFPLLIPAPGQDTLRIFDRAGRVSLFTDEGQFLRSHPLPLGYPVGVLANGNLLNDQNTASAGPDSPEGMVQNQVIYEVVDPVSTARDTIVQVIGQALFLGNAGGVISFTQVPFDVAPSAAVGRDRFYISDGESAEIRVFDHSGVQREVYRILLPAEPIPRAEFDRVVEERVGVARDQAQAAELRRRYARMPPPSSMPVIQRLLVDEPGNLWMERFHTDRSAPREWFILDPRGRALGRIETPPRFIIEHIGADFLLGWWPADADVERVSRYRLRRDP
jgi:hypothetical protein